MLGIFFCLIFGTFPLGPCPRVVFFFCNGPSLDFPFFTGLCLCARVSWFPTAQNCETMQVLFKVVFSPEIMIGRSFKKKKQTKGRVPLCRVHHKLFIESTKWIHWNQYIAVLIPIRVFDYTGSYNIFFKKIDSPAQVYIGEQVRNGITQLKSTTGVGSRDRSQRPPLLRLSAAWLEWSQPWRSLEHQHSI